MDQKKEIQDYYLLFINFYDKIYQYINDDDLNNKTITSTLMKYFNNSEIKKDKSLFRSLLHGLSAISCNYHRNTHFINKIEKILICLKDSILELFSNSEVFKIFKYDKRSLQILFDQKILVPDKILAEIITKEKFNTYNYPKYFFNEFKLFFDESLRQEIENEIIDINNFDEKRKIGENDNYICEMIRKDLIDDFIVYVNRTNLSLSSKITPSIFETSKILLDNSPSLAEYALFYGSIQIFQYLFYNNIKITENFFTYAIHSKNPEIFHYLEDNLDKSYFDLQKIMSESLRCHHIEFTLYLLDNYQNIRIGISNPFKEIFKNCNFIICPIKDVKHTIFTCLCYYDHFSFAKLYASEYKENLLDKNDGIKIKEVIKKTAKKGNDEILDFLMQLTEMTEIQDEFKNCMFLTKISIPPSVTRIDDGAFKGCLLLKDIKLPSSLTQINESMFEDCISLADITIPSNVTIVNDFAFKGCISLKNVIIPLSVTTINDFAFDGCSSLEEIELPSSLISLGHAKKNKYARFFVKNGKIHFQRMQVIK